MTEPVAWMVYTEDGTSVYVTDNPTDIKEGQRALPLYTKPQWQGLTEQDVKTIVENESYTKKWYTRKIGKIIEDLQPFDNVIFYEGADAAISTAQILEIIGAIARAQATVYFVKYKLSVCGQTDQTDTLNLIKLIMLIESDFVSRRTTFALARRRDAGLPLGRPAGSRNKSLKLDRNNEEIDKYLKLGISKASIAKLVGCHAQTLYDWLERRENRAA